ncbi:hypothetical protein ATKI12_5281 [Kitasatospora sp. Ki12]
MLRHRPPQLRVDRPLSEPGRLTAGPRGAVGAGSGLSQHPIDGRASDPHRTIHRTRSVERGR